MKKVITGCILLLMGLEFTGGCVRERKDQNMQESKKTPEFRLGFTQSLEAMFGKKMVVDHTGRCELWLESNAIQPEVPEIGYYVVNIDVSEAKELRNLGKILVEEPLPPSEPMLSGAPVASMFLEENDQVLTKSFDPYIPSKSWQEIKRRLPVLEGEALKAVKAGLRAELAFSTESADRSGRIGVIVRIAGVGTGVVSFYNPVAPSDTTGGRVMLMAVRSDIPEQELTVLHHKFCELSATELKSQMPEGPGHNKLLLQLKPEAELVLRFETVLDWPPGQYNVRLNLMSNGPQPKDDKTFFVLGQIVTPAIQLTITR